MSKLLAVCLMLIPSFAFGGVNTNCGGLAAVPTVTLVAACGSTRVTLAERMRERRASRLAARSSRLAAASCGGTATVACSGVAVVAVASVCVNCVVPDVVLGVEAASYTPAASGLQAEAQWEANEMARRGAKGHIRGVISGVRFAGVGWSSGSNPSTCTPGSGTCVADAIARGAGGFFRVRYYR